tara:strand:+ start:1849 stop:2589 length:741 start_codon:yes stop_codon:yes gene_type:complete
MALFTITTTAYTNLPPSSVGDITIELDNGGTHIFTEYNFTLETVPKYRDPEGDDIFKIKINTLSTTTGTLDVNGSAAGSGDEILMSDVIAGNVKWIDNASKTTTFTDNFTFYLSDQGSLSYSNDYGTFTFNVGALVNSAPSSVGNASEDINYGETLVFERSMFTIDTDPAYADPENDAADKLKITSLPAGGAISLSGVNVTVNQVIDFTEIDNGNLIYTGDLSKLSVDIESFSFMIADAGSGIFVG